MSAWGAPNDPLRDIERLAEVIREEGSRPLEPSQVLITMDASASDAHIHEILQAAADGGFLCSAPFSVLEAEVNKKPAVLIVSGSSVLSGKIKILGEALKKQPLVAAFGHTGAEALCAALAREEDKNRREQMIGGMAMRQTGSTCETTRLLYSFHDEIAWGWPPDDDIISPMWDFIKIDPRKQSRQNRYITKVNRNRTTRYCNKMMSSRSGYRGVRALKQEVTT